MDKKLISILGPESKLKLSPMFHIKLVSKIAMKMLRRRNSFLKTLARRKKTVSGAKWGEGSV